MTLIQDITAREILNAAGTPTLEAEVSLNCGALGRASIPAGITAELRDHDSLRYNGQGVGRALEQIRDRITPVLRGMDALDQPVIDRELSNLNNLASNARLAVSLAVAQAAAIALEIPLFRYLGGANAKRLPRPLVSIMPASRDGLALIDDIQLAPVKNGWTTAEAIRAAAEITTTFLNDDTPVTSELELLDKLRAATETCRYEAGTDLAFALSISAPPAETRTRLGQLADSVAAAPLRFVAANLAECTAEDAAALGSCQLADEAVNAQSPSPQAALQVLSLKSFQTLTDLLDAYQDLRDQGRKIILAADSQETDDTFAADLAIALHADYFRAGSLRQAEAITKYNHLLRLSESLC